MNVYDFDNTIYRGDSTARFLLYCVSRHPGCLAELPAALGAAMQYGLGLIGKTAFKQTLFRALRHVPEGAVAAFWRREIGRIKPWYLAQKRPDDLVVSAGPEFLIAPACALLGLRAPIASRVDPATGLYTGLNCDGEEKPRRFRAAFPDARAEAFYSDSLHDAPMAALADRAYLVRGDAVSPWPS